MSFNPLDLIILKNIITNKKYALEFVNENDINLFTPELWTFAKTITTYVKSFQELPTLRVITEKIAKSSNAEKQIETISNIWKELDKLNVDEKEYKHELGKLKQRFAEKQLLTTTSWMSKLELGNIDVNKSVSELQKTIQAIKSLEQNKTYEAKNIKDYLPAFVEKFNAKKNNPEINTGLMTKYSFLDYATNGLKSGDFVLIVAETGFGKSLLLNNIGIQVWLQNNKIGPNASSMKNGKNIIYFSLEMPYEDCFNRILSRLSGIPSRKIENSDLNKEEFNKIKQCLDFIKEYPYQFKIVDIVDACANDIDLLIEESNEKYDGVFIDYLGIMHPNEKSNEADWMKQGVISYEVRRIARKYKVPVFSAVQLNRKAGKDSGETVGLHRLARSATIATHATHIIQIETRPNENNHHDSSLHLIKNRKGPKLKGLLIKDLACATLLDKPDSFETNNYDSIFKDQDDISEEIGNLEI
jgi:replicative DNA helicase